MIQEEISKRQADDLAIAIAEENYKGIAIHSPHKNLKLKASHSRVEALLRHVRISSSRLKL